MPTQENDLHMRGKSQECRQQICLSLMEQGELQWSWNVHCLHMKYALAGVFVHWLEHKSPVLFTSFSEFGSSFVEISCEVPWLRVRVLTVGCWCNNKSTQATKLVANKFNGCWSRHCVCYSWCEAELNIVSPELTINVAKGWVICLPSYLWPVTYLAHTWNNLSLKDDIEISCVIQHN